MNVTVFGGATCATAMVLPSGVGSDSAQFNNCGAGDNTPGITCYAYNYQDMVFARTVEPGYSLTLWLSSLAGWSTKYCNLQMRWGGSCPGTYNVDCASYLTSAPAYNRRFTWTNSTGSTQTVYFTVGAYYSGTSYCGNFKLAC